MNDERPRVRMVALGTAGVALVVGAVLLGLGVFLGALGAGAVTAVALVVAGRMYADLHEEETARIAQGRARAQIVDPYPSSGLGPTGSNGPGLERGS